MGKGTKFVLLCIYNFNAKFDLKVQTLYSMGPVESHHTISISCRQQDAVIALGIYLLESKLQHKERIIPYFLNIAKLLEKATWPDEIKYNITDSKIYNISNIIKS